MKLFNPTLVAIIASASTSLAAELTLEQHLSAIEQQQFQLEGFLSFSPPRNFELTTKNGTFNVVLDAGRDLREDVQTNCKEPCDFMGSGSLELRESQVWLSLAGGKVVRPGRVESSPLTAGEKDALRVAMQNCWNVGSLSAEALRTTVIVGFQMDEGAKPLTSSIELLEASGGNNSAAEQAYEAARRAIIRCGSGGFDLPEEKYEHWREIKLTFDPTRMRIK